MAKLKLKRKEERKAMESLFPRSERGVTCGPVVRERHLVKAEFQRLAMRSPATVLAHLQD